MGEVTFTWPTSASAGACGCSAAGFTGSTMDGATIADGGYSIRGIVGWNVTSPPFRSRTFTPERSISSSEISVFLSISMSSLISFRFMIAPFRGPLKPVMRGPPLPVSTLLDAFDERAGSGIYFDDIAFVQIERHFHDGAGLQRGRFGPAR